MSPALQGSFLTTDHQGSPYAVILLNVQMMILEVMCSIQKLLKEKTLNKQNREIKDPNVFPRRREYVITD